METLRDQIFQTTTDFITRIQQLSQQHATHILQESFSSLGGVSQPASATSRARGVKRGADELDQLSQRFEQFVRANPGLRIEQINKQLGTKTADLALPIRKLIASGAVSVKGEKRATMYFPGKAPADKNGEAAAESPTEEGGKKRSRSKKSRSRTKAKTTKAKAKARSRRKSKE